MLEALGLVAKAYPNPFESKTTIEFQFADFTSSVKVEVFSLNGDRVAILFDGSVEGGLVNKVEFDAASLTEGIYIYRISTDEKTYYDKLILMK